uniref:SSD domain-containing protein n=1 Tax=Angiostrongylus cantonensis TaxID=6313 RepID=A0A158PCB7_ANGCA
MRFDCIERRLAQFFYSYGRYLSSNPLPFVVFPVLLTLAMATGFLHMQSLTDAVYLFTPRSAPSKLERQAIHEKWPLSDDNYIAGRAVTQNREIQVYSGCPGNKHVRRLSDFYNHGINITFPYFRFGTEGGYLGAALGGVSLMRTEKGSSILASARAWFLIYHLKFYPSNISYISGLWEKELAIHLSAYPEDPYIKITYFHSQTLADELRRNADSLMPRFVITFTFLVVFSMLCSIAFIDNTNYIDWVLSKPILAILGVVNAGMGIVTSIGTLLLLGLPYSDIVSVMPFLVVAVGTDNMFLMVAAMRRTSRCAPVAERMAECLSDAAVSILITATTDALSFGVGAITSLPAVHIFCVYTGVAISFKFQVTFFAALLAIFTRLEESGRNSILGQRTLTESDIKVATLPERLFNLGSKPEPAKGNEVKEAAVSRFFRDWYAPLLMNNVVRAITVGWYLIYLFFAYYGVTQIKEGLEPTNLLVQDSYAIPHYKLLQKYFWKYGAILQVVVNNAPDLRNATSRDRIHAMVGDFATTRHSIGKDSVQFWLYEMESYYHDSLDMKIIDDAFYSMLKHWLASKHNNPWVEDLYWDDTQDSNVTKFQGKNEKHLSSSSPHHLCAS